MQVACKTMQGDIKMISKEKLFFRPAAYAVIIDGANILLCNTKTTGKYWFPGGGVDLGESLEETVKREVREETGIEVTLEKFLTFKESFFYYEPLDEASQSYSFFFLCKPLTTKLLSDDELDPADESNKPRWIPLNVITEDMMQTGAEPVWPFLTQLRVDLEKK